jgi:serine protease AprX
MQEDLEFTVKLDVPQEFNAVIQFNENFSGGARAAYEEIVKLVERAKNEALEALTKRVESANIERQPEARKRHDGLLESIAKMKISPPQPTGYSFAFLHAAIIRRLLAANERLAAATKPDAQPIYRIHPKRFEIIIDLNLEYPGGREGARQWVIDHIEAVGP